MHIFQGNKKACQSNIAGRNIIRFYRLHYKLLGKQHFKGAIYGRMKVVASDRHPKTAEFGSQIVDTVVDIEAGGLTIWSDPKTGPQILDTEAGTG